MAYVPGQRWISETEPELGLGIIIATGAGTVSVAFPATGEPRQYALGNAPLTRVKFRVGETIQGPGSTRFEITRVEERGGLLLYHGASQQLPEQDVAASAAFSGPEVRLAHNRVDPLRLFELRFQTLAHQHAMRKSPVRGFTGGRIALIPHQLYIAAEVSGRHAPRVLLADEVGLGKTIEACLVLHRLILTGRAGRILVLVPEPLIHQWFVELLRRFNLRFSLFDEERCAAMELSQPDLNPFLDDQFVIAPLGWLSNNGRRQDQAVAAGWDVLVVDEAHHLGWSENDPSPQYALVEDLARHIPSVLLLTATPEQFGALGHFARLRLLDPNRYFDWDEFVRESGHYRDVARIASALIDHRTMGSTERETLTRLFPAESAQLNTRLDAIAAGDDDARRQLLGDLLDRHGTGRVMFRNSRANMKGFPARRVLLQPLSSLSGQAELRAELRREFDADGSGRPEPDAAPPVYTYDYGRDPRISWLADLLRQQPAEKFLLICSSRAKVEAIQEALRLKINVKVGVFHEQLPLLQRDRAAAWFAEDNGARILLCSEIGSEGRNFQFAHHLVLFDLPLNPELLEQRIGRLDRIGQTATINIHVPYVTGTPQEAIARWYHEGLAAFEQSLEGGDEVWGRFGAELRRVAEDGAAGNEEFLALLRQTRMFHRGLATRLAEGRDRLLELNSCRAAPAAALVQRISEVDKDRALETFLLDAFDHLGVHVEELSHRTYLLGAGDLVTEAFPGLPSQGLVVTADRDRALSREDIGFLTWDHPVVTGAIDSLLGSENGTTAVAVWEKSGGTGILLECVFVLECLAPAGLHAGRFLPPTPVRVVIDHEESEVTADYPPRWRGLKDAKNHPLLQQAEFSRGLLPRMLEAGSLAAKRRAKELKGSSVATMESSLKNELGRLRALQAVNPNVRDAEIALAETEIRELTIHLQGARLRLDALRLIHRS